MTKIEISFIDGSYLISCLVNNMYEAMKVMIGTNTSARMFGQAEDRLSIIETLLVLSAITLVEVGAPPSTMLGPPMRTEDSKIYCDILLKW